MVQPTGPRNIDRNEAISMAVFSGNLLFGLRDHRHFWAMTLIISNLFELVGDGPTSADRFVDGFEQIAPHLSLDETVHGWQFECLARAVRNWIDHGLELDRPQLINRETGKTVRIRSVGFVASAIDQGTGFLYDVDRITDEEHTLLFSPAAFWSLVIRWDERGR